MKWIELTEESQIDEMLKASFNQPQIIFKHSVQCPISKAAYNRVMEMDSEAWYVDVINCRPVSNKIEADFAVKHESPQVLIIKDGKSIYNESHRKIEVAKIEEQIA